jgi:DNA ligase-1
MVASSSSVKVAAVGGGGTASYPAPFDLSKRIHIDKLVAHADWPQNGPTPFLFLTSAFDAIDKTKKRLEIVDILCNCFRTIIRRSNPLDLLPAVYLSIGRLSPAHEGIESGCGESIIMKALADATGRSAAHIKSEYERLGDLGLIAQTSKSNQRTMFASKFLTVASVFAAFKEIALESGNSSQDKKKNKIQSLLVASRGSEATFIARSMQGKLRIGLAEQSVIVALARAVMISPPHLPKDPPHPDDEALDDAAATLRRIYSSTPSYDLIIPALVKFPLSELHEHCKLTPGLPVKPMLAHPTKGVTEVLDRFSDKGQFTCECVLSPLAITPFICNRLMLSLGTSTTASVGKSIFSLMAASEFSVATARRTQPSTLSSLPTSRTMLPPASNLAFLTAKLLLTTM